jgi:hypothetical protein
MVLNNSGAARAYGCLSTSFSRLERDIRRRGAFSLYENSNAFALAVSIHYLDSLTRYRVFWEYNLRLCSHEIDRNLPPGVHPLQNLKASVRH